MKAIKSIEMANDNDIYEVTFEASIQVKPCNTSGGFNIIVNGEESDWREREAPAIEEAKTYMIDDHMIISGYGTNSGRKFWQLPKSIQQEALAIASK